MRDGKLGALFPPLFDNFFHVTFIHVYILESVYCIRFPHYPSMVLNFSSLSLYPPPSAPLLSLLDILILVLTLYSYLTISSIFLSKGGLSVPLVPYSMPNLYISMNYGLLIIDLIQAKHISTHEHPSCHPITFYYLLTNSKLFPPH